MHCALLHVFGNFYPDFGKGAGYAYAIPMRLPMRLLIRTWSLMGHISGLTLSFNPLVPGVH